MNEISNEYPLGGMIEWYDIIKEQELCQKESIKEQFNKAEKREKKESKP